MIIRKALPRFVQISFLIVICISPLLVGEEFTPIAQSQDQSIPADAPGLSVILMIGDGMGYEHVELARLVEKGESGNLTMQQLTWNASAVTFAANSDITDSAAAATAIATGVKTNTGYVGMDPSKQVLENILEYAYDLNKSTGVITTVSVYHATPAGFLAHTDSRYNYDTIVSQIVNNDNVDVLLGGGSSQFTPTQLSTMTSNGYSIVYNRNDMLDVVSGKLLGLFSSGDMPLEIDRDYTTTPSLFEMTNQSLHILSQDPDGFFLMVEGGQIDYRGHANDKVGVALEAIEFDKAIARAVEYVDSSPNTILIVTADHETGGLTVVSNTLNDVLPGTFGLESDRRTQRIDRANNVTTTWTTTGHTAADVPIYAYGSAFASLPEDYTINNIDIYTLMRDYFDDTPLSVTQYEEPEPTTTSSSTTSTTGTTSETTSTTESTNTTTTSGTQTDILLDPMMLTAVAAGAAVVIIVILILVKKR